MSAPKDKALSTHSDPAGAENLGGVFRLESFSGENASPGAGAPGGPAVRFGGSATSPKRGGMYVVLLALVVVGGGVLYGMRLVGLGPLKQLADAQVNVDYNLNDAGASKTAEHQKVLAELNANQVAVQVPLEKVQRNPFRMASALSKPADDIQPDDGSAKAADKQRQSASARKLAIRTAFDGLKLNSVIAGSVPIARINGETIRVGDSVAEYFIVVSITGRGVELEADGQPFTLSIDADDRNAIRPRKPAK
jgi:hypothetical protein